jgi:hypothetical protein
MSGQLPDLGLSKAPGHEDHNTLICNEYGPR